jgi:hypothetical protein
MCEFGYSVVDYPKTPIFYPPSKRPPSCNPRGLGHRAHAVIWAWPSRPCEITTKLQGYYEVGVVYSAREAQGGKRVRKPQSKIRFWI